MFTYLLKSNTFPILGNSHHLRKKKHNKRDTAIKRNSFARRGREQQFVTVLLHWRRYILFFCISELNSRWSP